MAASPARYARSRRFDTLIAAAVPAAAAVVSAGALAFPEGAPWQVAWQDGCGQCHFDAPVAEGSDALSIYGLPEALEADATYRFVIRLEDERAATAGFLLSARQGESAAGAFIADDERTEASGAQARSTEAGSRPSSAGIAEWVVAWRAPADVAVPVELELWANAGNDDKSPFGDATHRSVFRVGETMSAETH
jgi:hypothetical protein